MRRRDRLGLCGVCSSRVCDDRRFPEPRVVGKAFDHESRQVGARYRWEGGHSAAVEGCLQGASWVSVSQRARSHVDEVEVAFHQRQLAAQLVREEVLWTYTAPDLYELLVLDRGWTVERYAEFLVEALIAALLSRIDGAP